MTAWDEGYEAGHEALLEEVWPLLDALVDEPGLTSKVRTALQEVLVAVQHPAQLRTPISSKETP